MSDQEVNNLELWSKVEETNPNYTKKANVKGNKITAISPQYQIKNVTEQFGVYGVAWGMKDISYDYTLAQSHGLVVFNAIFYFPNGEFQIGNSISLFVDNAKTKVDDNFAKKVETDSLTKAISKLGFNADIFMGKFEDQRYLEELKEKFKVIEPLPACDDDLFGKYCQYILDGTLDVNKIVITEAYLKERHTLTPEQEQELANV